MSSYTNNKQESGATHSRKCNAPIPIWGIFLIALLVRLAPLNTYITPDEPIWVMRAVQFRDAIATQQWAGIPQTGHPGLTTMVLGALGVQFKCWLDPVTATEHLAWIRNMAWLAPENSAAFSHLAYFLPAGRFLVALTTAAGVSLVYHLAKQRLGEKTGRLLSLILALDPFFAGHAGLLHTDGLQATFALLALLLCWPKDIRGEQTTSPWALLGVALCLALAGLTKSLGLLVAPGIALALLLVDTQPLWPQRVIKLTGMALLSVVFLLILYPPAWVSPIDALHSLLGAITYHEGIGLRQVFFAGRMTSDPGIFFYPVVVLFRLPLPVLAGLGIGLWRRYITRLRCNALRKVQCTQTGITKLRCNALRKVQCTPTGLYMILLPLLSYLVPLTIATKKFDRYALTLLPLLAIPAAKVLSHHIARWRMLLLAGLLLPWSLVANLPLYYANPLLGGPWVAQHVIPLGWGEGTGLVTTKLNRVLPGAEDKTLLSPNIPGTAAFFDGRTVAWEENLIPCSDGLITENKDYASSQDFTPVTRVRLAGIQLATGYIRTTSPALTTCRPLDNIPTTATPLARFAGGLMLQAAAWSPTASPPTAVTARLRWLPNDQQSPRQITLALEDEAHITWAKSGGALVDQRIWPADAWEVGTLVEGEAYLGLPLSLPPGTYTLTLGLYDDAGRHLGYWRPTGEFGGVDLPIGTLTVEPAPYPATELDLPNIIDVAYDGLKLTGYTAPPAEHWAGDPLPFSLGWERTVGATGDLLNWELWCNGQILDGGTLALGPSSPNEWPSGHHYITHYAPRTNPLLQDNECDLRVKPGDSEAVTLGTVQVKGRERIFSLEHPPQNLMDIQVLDRARLTGFEISGAAMQPGDTFTVTLYWEAQAPLDLDYTVFVHLASKADGQVCAQSDMPPQGGAAPTISWVAGQIIQDTHTLTIPENVTEGEYILSVGLYDIGTGTRATLYGGDGAMLEKDAVMLTEIVVSD